MRTLLFIFFLMLPIIATAASLTYAGIIGNSGEQGAALVRFDPSGASGMGVAYDRFGSLWDRAGEGTLNRYAPDGRLLGQYQIPRGNGGWTAQHQLALVGDTLVLCMNGRLYTLDITAPAGSAAKIFPVAAERISFNAVNGRLAAYNKGELFLVNVVTGEATKAGEAGGMQWMDMGPDEAIYTVANDWKMHKYVKGKEVIDGWPKACPGERPQLLDGCWFAQTWHGTIKRFTPELEPAPGVVLGGASGSFIGHLDQNPDLNKGCGMAKLWDGLFAVSGLGGILHLAQWDAEKRQMTLVRRIGAVPFGNGLGLDRQGNIWWFAGSWQWNDAPDTPMRNGVNGPDGHGVGQVVMLDNDMMVATGWLWGKPAFYHGKLSGEVAGDRIEGNCDLPKAVIGEAVYRQDNQLSLLAIEKNGNARRLLIDPEGRFRGDAPPVALQTAAPVTEWTSLAMKDPDILLAAADGQVIEFARNGADWKETRRWRAWGNDDPQHFGGKIYLTTDAGRLWVADRERQRVLVFSLKDTALLAAFGTVDKSGDSLTALATPQALAARGNRAVVYDQGNQRLVKLVLQ